MDAARACAAGHTSIAYGRLRPACCGPTAALAAFSRVGAWTPALPPQAVDGPAQTPPEHSRTVDHDKTP